MDTLYNIVGAKHALEEHQRWVEDSNEYLHSLVKLPSWETRYGLVHADSPPSWRLVDKTRGDNEEIVFNLQGIIEHKVLPPVLDARRISKPYLLSQSLRLVGLGTVTFEDSVKAAMQMFNVFSRQFPAERIILWEPPASSWT
ncbi:hypothetical protein BDN72DRAFT_865863, partial [Pluteus cervinus]